VFCSFDGHVSRGFCNLLPFNSLLSCNLLPRQELRELTKLEEEGYGAKFVVRKDELDLGATPSSLEELSQKGSRPRVRIDTLLRETAEKEATGRYQHNGMIG